MKKPDFLIIGGQKCATTWLWNMLKQHPDTDLPATKEIHYFGGIENFRKGTQWYYDHFRDIDPGKVTGEASTTYLFDRMPYWHNPSRQIEYDDSLPTIAELVRQELPEVKIIAILRDPVRRAISGYHHLMRRAARRTGVRKSKITVFKSLRKIAHDAPKARVVEYGFYSRYLESWMKVFPADRIKVFFFEEAVLDDPDHAIGELYEFLDIDPAFRPVNTKEARNVSWGWFSIMATKLMPNRFQNIARNSVVRYLDRTRISKSLSVSKKDLAFLKDVYREEKDRLERLLGRHVPWPQY